MNWNDLAARISWKISPFIGGDYRESASTGVVENINPSDETVLTTFGAGDVADIDDAVVLARKRFSEGAWAGVQPEQRAEILLQFADLVLQNRDELALLDTVEMGMPISLALFQVEILAAKLMRSTAGFTDKLVGQSTPLSSTGLSINCYEPRGVVGAITPWNFPTSNVVFKLAPALAAGNSVVLKPSELAPSSALRLAEIAIEAGIPDGVFNVVPGLGSTVGAALALHHGVDLVTFTGSGHAGRQVMEMCGRSNGKPLLMECGGKSCHVVFDDVSDVAAVAAKVVAGIAWNQGQVCSAHTRLLVRRGIKDELLALVAENAGKIRPGDPLDEETSFGPLASGKQRDQVREFMLRAEQDGAVPTLVGAVQRSGGCYVSPSIFSGVTPSMEIARREVFGPVLSVMEFDGAEEAIRLANDTEFGLAATVWTRDIGHAKRVAHGIKAAAISIKTGGEEVAGSGCVLSCEPFKASGFGAEIGLDGLKSYSVLKLLSFSGA